jgi:precorrin-6A/cobalt-precorrin-6A reductase
MNQIWLIGGTSESITLAKNIAAKNIPCLITVTTEAALNLYPQHPLIKMRVGFLTDSLIEDFFIQEKVIAIVDLSHPYAVEISRLAMRISQEKNLPYLRYERPLHSEKADGIINFESLEKLIASDYLLGKRVLLTIGCKALPLFKPLQDHCLLFTRILPTINALEIAIESGFTSDRIFAFRAPVSLALETALWQHWQVELVVTKASGKAGSEDVKRLVAQNLGVSLIVINRPQIVYPHQTSDLNEVLEFCELVR